MSIVTFELQDLAAFGIKKEEIQDIVEKLGMSFESIDEKAVTIDITPNRPDMLDIVGFARAAIFLNGKKAPVEGFYSITNKPVMQVKVSQSVKKVRPFIAAALIKNVDLKGSKLKNLVNFTEKFCETYGRKRRKIAIGIYDLDTISGPLTYTASKEGEFIPLGKKTKMKFSEILKSHDKGLEYSAILSAKKEYPFLKDSKGTILSLIPITNSEETKITNNTKNLLVEFTGTSKNSVEAALALVVCSFIDMSAEVYPCEISYQNKTVVTPLLDYKEIKVRRSKTENTLGVYLEDNKVVSLANKLGHVAAKYGNYTLVYVPPYRLDVLNEQDLIEDIAIAYGYDKIEPIPIMGYANGLPEESKERANRLSRLMIGMGFSEAMNPYLTNEHLNFESMGKKNDPESTINVAYAKTETITMLRTTLLPWLMQNLSNSTGDKMPQKLFEIGSTFCMREGKIVEGSNIGIVSEHSKANYSEIRAVVAEVLKLLGCSGYSLKELDDKSLISGRAAQILLKGKVIGYIGEVHPKVLENFKIEEPVMAAELMLGSL